ncbi:MAG: oligosaccharide flippase family protein [Alistipes sp.]
MLEKLAKQTAIYGVSTIIVRFLSYLLTPYYTRIFGQETYGIVTDVYALIPFALVLLSMGMESSYFRFAAKAEEAGGDVQAAKRQLFATTWGVTALAALLFCSLAILFRQTVAGWMGAEYVAHPQYVVWVALIILFDVWAMIPFSRLREQGRAGTFVGLKAFNVVINVVLAVTFGFIGLYNTPFGVGWVFVANFTASVLTWIAILTTTGGVVPRINRVLLFAILVYSLPLLISGVAGTANEFIDRQMIKYLTPEGAMAQLGIYGAITKIAVVMMLFTQMYRLAAEPFFLSNFKKQDFIHMNAAAMKYYLLVSMLIFLGIALFRDLFALIVGASFREGIYILPVVLGANVLNGVWLNLSFWYKREEKTKFAIVVTFSGLVFTIAFNVALVPHWGYSGAAWARLFSEGVMVVVSYWLNRRYFPIPYDLRRMAEYVLVALGCFFLCEWFSTQVARWISLPVNVAMLLGYLIYAVRREQINTKALLNAVLVKVGFTHRK